MIHNWVITGIQWDGGLVGVGWLWPISNSWISKGTWWGLRWGRIFKTNKNTISKTMPCGGWMGPIPEYQREHDGVSSEAAEFSKWTKSQFQKPWGGDGWVPFLNFKREHDGVFGQAEFSKRTITQFQKPCGGWMGPIPEFQSEHGSQGIFQTNKLSNFKNHGNLIILIFEVNRGSLSLPSLKAPGPPHMRKSGMTFQVWNCS